MSHARQFKQKPNKSNKLPTKQTEQEQQYQNQKKAGFFDRSRSVALTTSHAIHLYAGSGFMRRMLFLSLIFSVLQVANEERDHSFIKRMDAKLIVDPKLSLTEAGQLDRGRILTFLSSLYERSSVMQSLMQAPLNHPDFKIVCTSRNLLKENIGENDITFFHELQAFYNAALKILYIPFEKLTERDVIHEFYHANNHLRHQSEACYEPSISKAAVPVFPADEPALVNFNAALQRGDERVREFSKLLTKERMGVVLSHEEQEQLTLYKQAAANTVPLRIFVKADPILYEKVKQVQESLIAFTIRLEGTLFKLLDMRKVNDETYFDVEFVDLNESLIYSLDYTQHILSQQTRFYGSALRQVAEREAHTLESFPEGYDVFYPEVYELRKKDMEQCGEGQFSAFRMGYK